jgi:hypothetical protein
MPVISTQVYKDNTGIISWQVLLKKTNAFDKFGFTHLNGKLDFLRDRRGTGALCNSSALEMSAASCSAEEMSGDDYFGGSSYLPNLSGGLPTGSGSLPNNEDTGALSVPPNTRPWSGTQASARRQHRPRQPRATGEHAREFLTTLASDTEMEHPLPETLIVKKVNPDGDLLHEWNRAHPSLEVRPRDRIVEVNGKRYIDEMQMELRSECVTMTIQRYPETIRVKLKKSETAKKFGVKFSKPKKPNETWLTVSEVQQNGGFAQEEWNQAQIMKGAFHLVVTAGMRVEAVNEERDPHQMSFLLRNAEVVDMHLRRVEKGVVSGGALALLSPHSSPDKSMQTTLLSMSAAPWASMTGEDAAATLRPEEQAEWGPMQLWEEDGMDGIPPLSENLPPSGQHASAGAAILASALPPGWERTFESVHGQVYYYNTFTGETQWERPVDTDCGVPARIMQTPPPSDALAAFGATTMSGMSGYPIG